MIEDAMKNVFEACKRDGGINTSDGVRALVNAMFTICKSSDDLTDRQLIDNLALLTGMACGVMIEYAKRLEEEGQ